MKPTKISIAVCEYNPFHNGHKLHLDRMRENGDVVALIMSGNFCQRGEPAILDKYTRAEHAIKNGADIVFELPAVFSVAPAEIFASGAIKLIDSLPGKKTLFFGTEGGTCQDFTTLANILLTETKAFKENLKANLQTGIPHAKARQIAYETTYPDTDFSLLSMPNAVLGLEYTKALLKAKSTTQIQTIARNSGYNDLSLSGETASALAIRNAILDGKKKKIKKFVPENVYNDLPDKICSFDDIMLFKAIESNKQQLRLITDCTEGLENRIKTFATSSKNLEDFIDKLETKRYTRARLKRIITCNTLSITRDLQEKCLKSNLYLKVLAIRADKLNLLSSFSGGKHKLITRKLDIDTLSGTQKQCFLKDVYANDIYNLVAKTKTNEYEMRIVKI